MNDLRFALRQLRNNPVFAAVAILTLAIGIGANTAIFSVVNAVILRPLSFPEPERLVRLYENQRQQNLDFIGLSAPGFNDWRAQSKSFESMAAYAGLGFDLTGDGDPRRVPGARVSASFFPLLGVSAVAGRLFTEAEDSEGRKQVALLGNRIWQERYGGSRDILGKSIVVDGKSLLVIGVLPPGFTFDNIDADIWTPMGFEQYELDNRGGHNYQVVARLKSGVSIESARAELATIEGRLAGEYPVAKGWGATLTPLHESLVGNSRRPLAILMGAVAMILLIACANVASLLLARGAAREQEFALRASLGASQSQIMRQLLTESATLAAAGGAGGWLVAMWLTAFIGRFGVNAFPRLQDTSLDGRMALFTAVSALLTAFVFGLAPARACAKMALAEALKTGARGSTAKTTRGLRSGFVVAQIAISLALLIGASLLLRSFARLQAADFGYRPEGILTVAVAMPDARFPGRDADRKIFLARAVESLSALPGVESAASVLGLPLSFINARSAFTIEGRPETIDNMPAAGYSQVSTNYFKTIGATLLRGRNFDRRDTTDAPLVAIVNERFARTFFPNEDPIGKRLSVMDSRRDLATEIVGVVHDMRQRDLASEPGDEMYFPTEQRCWANAQLVVRTSGDPMRLEASVRAAIAQIDPLQTISFVRTLEALMEGALKQRKLQMTLLASFAGIALLLSAVGIFGLMSYVVTHRTHEIGIRMSLGAARRQILELILSQSLRIAGAGIAIGLIAAWSLSGVMRSLLYEIGATDWITYVAVALLMTVVAIAASLIPARRATRIDPLAALRAE